MEPKATRKGSVHAREQLIESTRVKFTTDDFLEGGTSWIERQEKVFKKKLYFEIERYLQTGVMFILKKGLYKSTL